MDTPDSSLETANGGTTLPIAHRRRPAPNTLDLGMCAVLARFQPLSLWRAVRGGGPRPWLDMWVCHWIGSSWLMLITREECLQDEVVVRSACGHGFYTRALIDYY